MRRFMALPSALRRFAQAIESCERGMAFGSEWPDYMVLTAAYALYSVWLVRRHDSTREVFA